MTNIDGDVLIERIRERCEEDFKFFVKYFFKTVNGSKFLFSPHHEIICDALTDIYYGRTTHLVINCPPRYSKTELAIKMFSSWCYAKNHSCEFIHLSYSDGLAMDNSNCIKDILKSHEFNQLWPDLSIKTNKDSKKAWGTVQGGSFYATSAAGQVTGYGAGKAHDFSDGHGFGGALLLDDPLKPDDAHSNPKREAVNRRWDETIKSRFNSTKTPCILIMQRVHEDDFCAMLLEDSEYDFRLIKLEAIAEEGTENEHALWPGKHTLEDLYKMRKKNTYMFSSQMQQSPSPLGGGIIKGAWFGRYTILPKMKYRAIYVDTAQKKGENNDFQVAECWGLGEDGYLYLIDVMRDKFEAYELETRIPDFWHKHYSRDSGKLRHMGIEDKSSGTELIQKIRRKVVPKIPVKDIPRGPKANKITRVMDIQGYIESGYVKLPESAPWVADFINECESFTADDTHKNDDQIDPMCDAITDMLGVGNKREVRVMVID
jgi:predicted phage terminase large subunit-like protein